MGFLQGFRSTVTGVKQIARNIGNAVVNFAETTVEVIKNVVEVGSDIASAAYEFVKDTVEQVFHGVFGNAGGTETRPINVQATQPATLNMFDNSGVYHAEECAEHIREEIPDAIRQLTQGGYNERKEVLSDIAEVVKGTLDIDFDLKFTELDQKICGDAGGGVIRINTLFIDRQPVSISECADMIDTVVHEGYHIYQQDQIRKRKKSSIPPEVLDSWKDNFRHYISYRIDPRDYRVQPVEATAFEFAHTVMEYLAPGVSYKYQTGAIR